MEEIINNIMQSPENTNPNILRSQLQSIAGSGGGGVADIEGTPLGNHQYSVNKPMSAVLEAMQNGARIRATATNEQQGYHVEYYLYLVSVAVVGDQLMMFVTTIEQGDLLVLVGSESGGITTFAPV